MTANKKGVFLAILLLITFAIAIVIFMNTKPQKVMPSAPDIM